MKKNNTAVKTILEAENIAKSLKKSTDKCLQDMLNEAISNAINESDDDEEVEDEDVDTEDNESEDSYEVEDVDTDDAEDETSDEEESTDDGEEDEWSDEEEYKVGDNDYDFTEADEDTVLKVYNKLGDDDQIFIKKDGDGTYTMTDDENGTEYTIELNSDDFDDDADVEDFNDDADEDIEIEISDDADDDFEGEDVDFEIEMEDDATEEPEDDSEFEIEMEDDDDDEEMLQESDGADYSNSRDIKPMGGSTKQVMTLPTGNKLKTGTRNLGDLSKKGNGEPEFANTQAYGKRGDDDPFDNNINEMIGHGSAASRRGSGKSTKENYGKTRHASKNGEYSPIMDEKLEENVMRILDKAKQIQAENKQYKKMIGMIKKSLSEAAVLNVSLGQVVRLLSENTTTSDEKKNIVERFNNVKTISESKNLYRTISNELKSNRSASVMLEHQMGAQPSKMINETTFYQTKKSNPAIDMMNRLNAMEDFWKGK